MAKRTAGNITYRNGRWEVKVVKYDPYNGETIYTQSGLPARLSKSFNSKKEAELFIADYQLKRVQCKPFTSSVMLLKDWHSTWFDLYKKSGVKPYTIDTAETVFTKHILPALGNIKLCQLTSLHIQRLYSNLNLAPKTIKNIHSFLNSCLDSAVAHGLLVANPCSRVQLPKARKHTVHPLSKTELSCLVKEVSQFRTVYDYVIYFTVFTGLRMGEVLGLTWDKVDLSSRKITVDQQLIKTSKHAGGVFHLDRTKSDNSRTFLLPRAVLDMLIQYQLFQNQCQYVAGDKWNNDLNLIFTMSDTGKCITPPTLHKHFKRVATKIGRPDLRFHDLRHTFATNAAEAGLSVANLSRVLGHSQTSTTMQYYVHSTDVGDVFCASVTDELIKSIS